MLLLLHDYKSKACEQLLGVFKFSLLPLHQDCLEEGSSTCACITIGHHSEITGMRSHVTVLSLVLTCSARLVLALQQAHPAHLDNTLIEYVKCDPMGVGPTP